MLSRQAMYAGPKGHGSREQTDTLNRFHPDGVRSTYVRARFRCTVAYPELRQRTRRARDPAGDKADA
jgi:hypothetical protein